MKQIIDIINELKIKIEKLEREQDNLIAHGFMTDARTCGVKIIAYAEMIMTLHKTFNISVKKCLFCESDKNVYNYKTVEKDIDICNSCGNKLLANDDMFRMLRMSRIVREG